MPMIARLTARPGSHATGRLNVIDGSAGLRGRARFRFRLNRNGSANVLGRLRARAGPQRAAAAQLPRARTGGRPLTPSIQAVAANSPRASRERFDE
jgi:hypothetical protein